jgi:hypothetical protein
MKPDRWGKRAEKIVAMTTAQLHVAAEKVDPTPKTDKHSGKQFAVSAAAKAPEKGLSPKHALKRGLIPDGRFKKQLEAHEAAEAWLKATATKRGPNASHARLIAQMMRRDREQLEDYFLFTELFWRVRHIDLATMLVLITRP